jgi:hypothetical protein
MMEGMPTKNNENEWGKTGQGVRFGEEIKDPQSKIWLMMDGDTVRGPLPPNMGTVTEEQALAYAKEKFGPDATVKEHHTSTTQQAEEL